MGMLIYDALVLAKVTAHLQSRRRVLTLGVPTLNFGCKEFAGEMAARPTLVERGRPAPSEFSDALGFFRALGFEQIDSLDISSYEGANIVGDLNDPNLIQKIPERYDLIYDSGTIEHIFDAPTALRTISRAVEVGGVVVHATPGNGFTDHGFWQVSPDLFRTFYSVAGFEILTSAIFNMGGNRWSLAADANLYRTHGRRYIVEMAPEAIVVFAARKMRDSQSTSITMQDYYATMHEGQATAAKSKFFIEYGCSPSLAGTGVGSGAFRRKYQSLRGALRKYWAG
jgi:hypothetical protein